MQVMSRLLAGIALAGFLAAGLIIAVVSATSGGDGGRTTTAAPRTTVRTQTAQPTTTATTRKTSAIKLTGSGAYDPYGDRHENDDLAPLAVDGDATTFWKSEHYRNGFGKPGVGLLLDAGRRRSISKIVVVVADAPGASARIDLGDSPNGPFDPASAERKLNGTTAFPLKNGAAGRYIVVWLTGIPEPAGEAHIAEVRAFVAA